MVDHDDKTLREGVKKPSRETLSVQGKVSVAGVFDTSPTVVGRCRFDINLGQCSPPPHIAETSALVTKTLV